MRIHLFAVLLSFASITPAFAADGDRAERPVQPDPRQEPGHGALPQGVKAAREGGGEPNLRRGEGERPADGGRREGAQLGGPFEHITGLTDEQRTRLAEIRRKYEELARKQQEELLAVLTEEQRREFQQIILRGRQRIEDRKAIPGAVERGDREGRREKLERDRAGDKANPEEANRERSDVGAPMLEAIITKIDVPDLWIKLPTRGDPVKFTATDKTVITHSSGKSATFAELKVGQRIRMERSSGKALRIEIQDEIPAK